MIETNKRKIKKKYIIYRDKQIHIHTHTQEYTVTYKTHTLLVESNTIHISHICDANTQTKMFTHTRKHVLVQIHIHMKTYEKKQT